MKTMVLSLLFIMLCWNSDKPAVMDTEASARVDTPVVNVPHRQLQLPCDACHTTESWTLLKTTIAFDHEKTGFPLRFAHASRACSECHSGGRFNRSVRECQSCHRDAHQGQLGFDCERCHTEAAWSPSIFMHDAQTFFMTGAHRGLDCASCHKNLTTFRMPNVNACGDCHVPVGAMTDHNRYKAIDDCFGCHSLNAWDDYPHLDEWFSLTGHHRRSCERCHKQIPNYTTYTCRDCHSFDQKGDRRD